MSAPLALKRQKVASRSKVEVFPHIAQVIVDNGVFHLDEPFSYGIPDHLLGQIGIGSYVSLSFREQKRTGVVIDLVANTSQRVLPILDLLDSEALSTTMVALIEKLVARYACSRHDLIRFALPGIRMENRGSKPEVDIRPRKPSRSVHIAKSDGALDHTNSLLSSFSGKVLVITDTARSSSELIQLLTSQKRLVIDLTSPLRVGELRERLTKARAENDVIIIGLRSSIFASVGRVDHLVVINEWSEHHWERQSPYWNSRDVALTRQEIEENELHFIGDAISTELGRLLDIGYLTMRKAPTRWIRPRKRTITFSPDTYHRSISEGLKSGPVLVSVAARNYVSSLLCARCRSKAICHCGGAMQEMSPSQYSCSLCLRKENSLKCSQCHGTKFLMLRKGAERIAEELGKAFPNIAIHKVNADSSPFIDSKKPSIVISTLGAEPRISPKYAAGVLLDGELLANGATLRSEEATWQRWWRIVGLLRTEAPIYISLPSEHTISQSIASGSHQIFLHRTLAARKDSSLPPYSRMIEISGDLSALRNLALKLKDEITLPLEIYPLSSDGNLWIKSSLESTPSILKTLRVVQRYRSASKRELLSIKVDSYQI